MAKEIKGAWRLLTITDEEKDFVEDFVEVFDVPQEAMWLVIKIF